MGLGSCSGDVRGLPDFRLLHSLINSTLFFNFHHKVVKSPPQEKLDVPCLLIEKVAGETVGKQWPTSCMHLANARSRVRGPKIVSRAYNASTTDDICYLIF